MKTEVIMKRELFGREISQESKSEMFSATDLVRAGNAWRVSEGMSLFNMNRWFNLDSTKEFVAELELQYGKVKISGRGRGNHTWVHPFLFIDMALSINPNLKIEVYKWLYDHLLKYRNDSGDSYKRMCGAIACNSGSREITATIKRIATRIKNEVGAKDWQIATEEQLSRRDKIQEKISTLSDLVSIDKALDIAIRQTRNQG